MLTSTPCALSDAAQETCRREIVHGEVRTSPTTKEKGTARRLSKAKVRPGLWGLGNALHVVVPDSSFLKQDVKIVLAYCTTQDSFKKLTLTPGATTKETVVSEGRQ